MRKAFDQLLNRSSRTSLMGLPNEPGQVPLFLLSDPLWKASRDGVWQKRYFFLNVDTLAYGKSGRPEEITFSMPTIDVIKVEKVFDEKISAGKPFSFIIHTPDRPLLIAAESETKRMQWIKMVEQSKSSSWYAHMNHVASGTKNPVDNSKGYVSQSITRFPTANSTGALNNNFSPKNQFQNSQSQMYGPSTPINARQNSMPRLNTNSSSSQEYSSEVMKKKRISMDRTFSSPQLVLKKQQMQRLDSQSATGSSIKDIFAEEVKESKSQSLKLPVTITEMSPPASDATRYDLFVFDSVAPPTSVADSTVQFLGTMIPSLSPLTLEPSKNIGFETDSKQQDVINSATKDLPQTESGTARILNKASSEKNFEGIPKTAPSFAAPTYIPNSGIKIGVSNPEISKATSHENVDLKKSSSIKDIIQDIKQQRDETDDHGAPVAIMTNLAHQSPSLKKSATQQKLTELLLTMDETLRQLELDKDQGSPKKSNNQLKTKLLAITNGCRNLEDVIDALAETISLHPSRELAIREIKNITTMARSLYILALEVNQALKEMVGNHGQYSKVATDSAVDPATPEQARVVMYLAIGGLAKELKRYINCSRLALENEKWKEYRRALLELKDSVHKLQLSASMHEVNVNN